MNQEELSKFDPKNKTLTIIDGTIIILHAIKEMVKSKKSVTDKEYLVLFYSLDEFNELLQRILEDLKSTR